MIIDKHISNLLYDHDCVIVPTFGGFVGNYAPAKIHPVQHTFTPPSKQIAFNRSLKNNDGLLANEIANSDKITFAEANKRIQNDVNFLNNELKKGKKVRLQKIGVLSMDVEHRLQFKPDDSVNYLPDAFGLTTLRSPAIKRDKASLDKFIDRKPEVVSGKKINVKKYVALAIVAPVLLATGWLAFETNMFRSINYANLNVFAHSAPAQYTPAKGNSLHLTEADFKATPMISSRDTTATASLFFVKGQQPIVVRLKKQKTIAVADKTATHSSLMGQGYYHVIAGCFRYKRHAERLVRRLKRAGIRAAIIGKTPTGLYMVSTGTFRYRRHALRSLSAFRSGHNPNAWLLRD